MDLVTRVIALTLFASVAASAQSLSLTIGNTVAGQNYMMKSAQFVFRVNGCADVTKAQVTATAEGLVGGVRRSTPLQPVPVQTQAGVYAIGQQWGNDGKWVVAITASCLNETAGAVVPVERAGFNREGTQLLSHGPSQAEIEAGLKAAAQQTPAGR